jgi:hypothetical protein
MRCDVRSVGSDRGRLTQDSNGVDLMPFLDEQDALYTSRRSKDTDFLPLEEQAEDRRYCTSTGMNSRVMARCELLPSAQ